MARAKPGVRPPAADLPATGSMSAPVGSSTGPLSGNPAAYPATRPAGGNSKVHIESAAG
jgi:hypothetical protein